MFLKQEIVNKKKNLNSNFQSNSRTYFYDFSLPLLAHPSDLHVAA